MEKKEYTYICVYEHISGERIINVYTGTFHVVYKKACRYRPMDCVLVEIKKA